MKRLLSAVFFAACAANAVADASQAAALPGPGYGLEPGAVTAVTELGKPGEPPADPDPDDLLFSAKKLDFTPQERAALELAQKWRTPGGTAPGQNGAISFVFGLQQPTIICAVLQVCAIALQPGEWVTGLNIGDGARWMVTPEVSGSGEAETQYIVVKPLDVGLETSFVATTNRRVYHVALRSSRKEYMPLVSFIYPEEQAAKWRQVVRREEKDRKEKTLPSGEYLGNLSFDYSITGTAAWRPVRVYNDGAKTILEMPGEMKQTEAPALLVVRKEGGWFSDDETVMVNYRVQGTRYVVDNVFDKALLIVGVGSSQEKVIVQRGGPNGN